MRMEKIEIKKIAKLHSVLPIIDWYMYCIRTDIGLLVLFGIGYLGIPIPINSHSRQSSSS